MRILLVSLISAVQALWPARVLDVPPALQPCRPPFELRLPFRESSVWQSYVGDPASTFEGFHVIRGQFIPGSMDTWFVYGLHGNLAQNPTADVAMYPQWDGRHNGLDFEVVPGLYVLAAADGRVSYTGEINGFGGTVVVEHLGGLRTTYGGLGSITVRPGQRVYVGDQLGSVGGTGRIAHQVHLELDRDNRDGTYTAINPLRYLDLATAIVPRTKANRFNRGSLDPAKQPDFNWDLRRYLPV